MVMLSRDESFEALAAGFVLKGVTCDRCQQQYAYVLAKENESVPCPKCGAFGKDQVPRLPGPRRFSRWDIAAVCFLSIGAVGAFFQSYEVAISFFCLGMYILLKRLPGWYQAYLLRYPMEKARGTPGVWTREELEALAAKTTRIDITPALLDWECKKHQPKPGPDRPS
jgi:hypothetical protein